MVETCLSYLNSRQVKALPTTPAPNPQRVPFVDLQRALPLDLRHTRTPLSVLGNLRKTGPFRLRARVI